MTQLALQNLRLFLAIVGAVNLPIIKFSVEWWNTLHQPASVSRFDAPAIDPAIASTTLTYGVRISMSLFPCPYFPYAARTGAPPNNSPPIRASWGVR